MYPERLTPCWCSYRSDPVGVMLLTCYHALIFLFPVQIIFWELFWSAIYVTVMPFHGFILWYFTCLFLLCLFVCFWTTGVVGYIIWGCIHPSNHYLSFKWKFTIHIPSLPNDLIHTKIGTWTQKPGFSSDSVSCVRKETLFPYINCHSSFVKT